MGCIMTPMPNHLSTYLSLFTTHLLMSGGGVDEKSEEENGECGNHTTQETKNNTTE